MSKPNLHVVRERTGKLDVLRMICGQFLKTALRVQAEIMDEIDAGRRPAEHAEKAQAIMDEFFVKDAQNRKS